MITTGSAGRFNTWVHEIGYNAGGGVNVFVSEHRGIRADVRYIQSFQNGAKSWTHDDQSTFDVAAGRFDFLRGAVGFTLRFGGIRRRQ